MFSMEWWRYKITPTTSTYDPPTGKYVPTEMAAELAAAFLEESEREQSHANTRDTGSPGRVSRRVDRSDEVEPMETDVSPTGTPDRE